MKLECKKGFVAVEKNKDGTIGIDVVEYDTGNQYYIDDGTVSTLDAIKKRLQC
jgi:hypothetical protein